MSEYISLSYEIFKNKNFLCKNINNYSLLQLMTLFSFDFYGMYDLSEYAIDEFDDMTFYYKSIADSNTTILSIIKYLKKMLNNIYNNVDLILDNNYRNYILWLCDNELKSSNELIKNIENNPNLNHYYIENKYYLYKKIPFEQILFNCLITCNNNPYWIEYKKNNNIHIKYEIILNENKFIKSLLLNIIDFIKETNLLIYNRINHQSNGITTLNRILNKEIKLIIKQIDFC